MNFTGYPRLLSKYFLNLNAIFRSYRVHKMLFSVVVNVFPLTMLPNRYIILQSLATFQPF